MDLVVPPVVFQDLQRSFRIHNVQEMKRSLPIAEAALEERFI